MMAAAARRGIWLGAIAVASALAGACASAPPTARQECANPDTQLRRVLEPLEALRAKGCDANGAGTECERLRRELERLTVICPGYAPTLMANAVSSYDEHRPAKAQQFLDQILAQPGSHADAAVLRARIAIEDGNVPFARRLLVQQMRLAPDRAELHETYGAVLYVAGELPEARRELATAGALGAPRWRIAYHLGLIEEAAGQLLDARRFYTEAVEANPGWAPAEARLKALRARDATRQ
jgi:Tfp pilus assembly protein PilF